MIVPPPLLLLLLQQLLLLLVLLQLPPSKRPDGAHWLEARIKDGLGKVGHRLITGPWYC
jgi:hypothetical protein